MDAVIFDMDGVLVDSESYWHQWEPALYAEALPDEVDPETAMNELIGMNYQEMYDYLAARFDMQMPKEDWVAAFNQQAEQIYQDKVAFLDGATQLLTDLQEHGVKTAIASSSPRQWIDCVLSRFNLRALFDHTISAEEIPGEGKPAPDIYHHAAAELDVAPEECVVIEDSAHGVAAAKAAGMTCIGFRTQENQDTDLSAADVVAAGPNELTETLRERLQNA